MKPAEGWQADDGTFFTSEGECLAYEARHELETRFNNTRIYLEHFEDLTQFISDNWPVVMAWQCGLDWRKLK